MNSVLKAVASKVQICTYLCMFSAVAAAQGTGAIVESPGITPGQASRQSATAPAAGNNDALSLLLQQNQQLQTEVQALRGMIEEQGFELRKLQRDTLARYTNMDERLTALESGAARNANSLTPIAPRVAPDSAPANLPGAAGVSSGINSSTFPSSTSGTVSANAMPGNIGDTAVSGNRPSSLPAVTTQSISAQPGSAQASSAQPTTAQPDTGLAANTASASNNRRGTLQPAVLSEQQLYQMAYDSVINSNFERSIAEFDQYLSIYPRGRFVTNAHYWKGQAYLYLNRYEEARAAYEIIINQYADSPKLSDAMYGLGLAHQGLGNIEQARRLLNDIKRRFPNTGVANLADTRLLSLD